MKKPIVAIVVLVLAIFAVLVAISGPGDALYGIKSIFTGEREPEETVLGGYVTDLETELSAVEADENLTSAEAADAKSRIINALIGISTEVNNARESDSVNDATKEDLKRNLYRLNDSYADQRSAILKIDSAMGIDSGSNPQSLLTLLAQTQFVFKDFVVGLTGTGIILREAADDEAIDAASKIEVDDATGQVIFRTETDKGEEAPTQ